MMSSWLLASLLASPARAGGVVSLEALAGARSSPQLTSQGPSELVESEGSVALAAVRVDMESGSLEGAWLGGGFESWTYAPDPDLSVLRAEPRAGWRPPLGEVWRFELGARYALESYPWSAALNNGRGELTSAFGPTLLRVRLAIEGGYVRRDVFAHKPWSFQAVESRIVVATASKTGGVRASARLGGQFNRGFTIDAGGASHPATGSQLRVRADVGWTRRSVDLNMGWQLIVSREGNVEDAARPQFTPIGQYADDADALSAGGFVQNRIDLSVAWTPAPKWTLGLDGMGRIRRSEPGQASATLATSVHLQGRVEREVAHRLTVSGTLGSTRVDLVNGAGALDVYGWAGLTWRPDLAKPDEERGP